MDDVEKPPPAPRKLVGFKMLSRITERSGLGQPGSIEFGVPRYGPRDPEVEDRER